jgi:hypothetical protein
MWWKILRLWGKVPPELKKLILWLFQEIAMMFMKGKKPKKVATERLLLDFVKQSGLPDDKQMFIMTVIKYQFNDGKISMDELGSLIKLWCGLNEPKRKGDNSQDNDIVMSGRLGIDSKRSDLTKTQVMKRRKRRVLRGACITGNNIDPVLKKNRLFNNNSLNKRSQECQH